MRKGNTKYIISSHLFPLLILDLNIFMTSLPFSENSYGACNIEIPNGLSFTETSDLTLANSPDEKVIDGLFAKNSCSILDIDKSIK